MLRIGVAVFAAALVAACASGSVDSDGGNDDDIDSGVGTADADVGTPDAAGGTPDAAAGTPDAAATPDAPGTPDAEVVPDADPAMPPTVVAVVPNTGSIAGGETVTVSGLNFFSDVAITFGGMTASCTFVSATQVTCTTPATGTAGPVDVVATQSTGSHTLTDGFLYWSATGAVDGCNLVPPNAVDYIQGATFLLKTRVTEPGITDVTTGTDTSAVLRGQLGYGPSGTDPTVAPGWTWFDLDADATYGPASSTYQANYDQYLYGGTVPTRGQFAWSARYSIDAGVSWKFCGTGTMTSRLPITCTLDGQCFSDEKCLSGKCRVWCDTNGDCKPWGPQCTGLGTETDGTTLELFCDPGSPGGAGLGATCTGDSGCESGLCLVDLSDTCTVGCGIDDANCSGAAGNVCTEFSGLGLCAPSCGAASDCGASYTCVLNQNDGQNRYDTLCLVPAAGSDPFGSDCSGVIACESGICLTGPDLCTAPCNTGADCGGALPTCGLGTITRPNGVGTQTIPICVN